MKHWSTPVSSQPPWLHFLSILANIRSEHMRKLSDVLMSSTSTWGFLSILVTLSFPPMSEQPCWLISSSCEMRSSCSQRQALLEAWVDILVYHYQHTWISVDSLFKGEPMILCPRSASSLHYLRVLVILFLLFLMKLVSAYSSISYPPRIVWYWLHILLWDSSICFRASCCDAVYPRRPRRTPSCRASLTLPRG